MSRKQAILAILSGWAGSVLKAQHSTTSIGVLAEPKQTLTIDLQWMHKERAIVVRQDGKERVISAQEIWDALK